MKRIDAIFARHRQAGTTALMPFVTVGDPDLDTTAALLPVLEKAGADVVELGIPFSDPIADGPIIQASMHHALTRGMRLDAFFAMVAAVRPTVQLGLMAMVSYSIIYRCGADVFLGRCAEAGIDGLIVPDLMLEESGPLGKAVAAHGLALSMLIAPTTPPDRAGALASASSGFVYVMARGGITGESSQLPPELPQRLQALRSVTDLPLAVGFGISSGQQVRQVTEVADAAIVGSALVRRIAERRDAGRAAILDDVASFTSELAAGLTRRAAPSGV